MGQQANITAFDGASTPVSHTLIGDGVYRDKDGTIRANWKEALAGVPDYAQVRMSMTKKKLPSGIFRVSQRTEVPIMEAVAGSNSSGYTAPPKVAYVDTHEVVGYFHERSVQTGRRLARQLGLNIANGISTSVAPVTVGPSPELFDQLIQVS